MSRLIVSLINLLRNPFIRWPLLLGFFLALPWIILIIPIYGPNNFTYSQLNLWLILSVVAIGLNLLTGLTGMISLGHSAIYAVGVYVAGYFTSIAHFPFPLALILAAAGGGMVGLVLGLPALRLSGPYLAVATFAFAIGVPQILSSSKEVGALFADPNDVTTKIGVFKVPKQTFPGFQVSGPGSDLGRYYLFLVIAALVFFLSLGIWRSRTGRAFRAIRDSETAAQALGINLALYKVLAFIISSMFAGVAGAMYSFQVGQIEATDLQFSGVESVLFLTAIILGGLGSIWGAVIGAAALTILPNAISALNQLINEVFKSKIENFESIFYGLIIILCIFFMPRGLVGAFKQLFEPRKKQGAKGPAIGGRGEVFVSEPLIIEENLITGNGKGP